MEPNILQKQMEKISNYGHLYKNWMQGDDLAHWIASAEQIANKARQELAAGSMDYITYKHIINGQQELQRNVNQLRGKEVVNLKTRKISSNPILITTSSIDATKKNKRAWYSTVLASDKKTYNDELDLTETQLESVKKHDVVDVGHQDKEIKYTLEKQLEKGENKRLDAAYEITESQLAEAQVGEEEVITTEGQLNNSEAPHAGSRKEGTWGGDDIKLFREVNHRQKENARANQAFYKNNPERTKGGKGTVSASVKKAQVQGMDENPQAQSDSILDRLHGRFQGEGPKPVYVSVYRQTRAYGGPEEGGWWYDVNELAESKKFYDREEAERFSEQLREHIEVHGLNDEPLSSSRGMDGYPDPSGGDPMYDHSDNDIPLGFSGDAENYWVTLEDNQGESTTQGRPHYE